MGKKRAVAIKTLILIVLVTIIVEWNGLPLRVNMLIFTARKRSFRRLCFYTCLSVILFTGGSTWAGATLSRYTPDRYIPLGRFTPQAGTHPGRYSPLGRYPPGQVHPQAGTPPGRYTPWAGTPPRQVHPQAGTPQAGTLPLGRYTSPWAGTPPWADTPPWAGTPTLGRYTCPPASCACWEIWGTSGRYASYWNAFFFTFCFHPVIYLFKNHIA